MASEGVRWAGNRNIIDVHDVESCRQNRTDASDSQCEVTVAQCCVTLGTLLDCGSHIMSGDGWCNVGQWLAMLDAGWRIVGYTVCTNVGDGCWLNMDGIMMVGVMLCCWFMVGANVG